MTQKRIKLPQAWRIVVFLLVVLAGAGIAAAGWGSYRRAEREYARWWSKHPRPAALRNSPRVLKALPLDQSIAEGQELCFNDNRYRAADWIITALKSYYLKEGCYPPYLFGGDHVTKEEFRSLPESWRSAFTQEIDPLLQGGYLKEYPSGLELDEEIYVKRYFNESYHAGFLDPVVVDQRGVMRYRCMYSTPGDYVQLGLDPAFFMEFYKHYPEWERQQGRPRDFNPAEWKLTAEARSEALGGSGRLFALGGVAKPRRHRFNDVVDYRLHPGKHEQEIRTLFNCMKGPANFHDEPEAYDVSKLPYFGYQRGEWFGADDQEAWLWFYGSNLWPVNYPQRDIVNEESLIHDPEAVAQYLLLHNAAWYPGSPLGLDLLNAETGELEPDGIADGICLLCKLNRGNLVEAIDAGI